MTKLIVKSIYCIISLFFISCLKEKQGLNLKNESGEIIFYEWNFTDSLSLYSPYPLTFTYQKIEDYKGTGKTVVFKGIEGDKILPDSTASIIGGGRIEYGFRGSSAKSELEQNGGYITIFIFDKAFLKKHAWNEVIKKQLYTKKYRLSVAELEKKNWEIIYK